MRAFTRDASYLLSALASAAGLVLALSTPVFPGQEGFSTAAGRGAGGAQSVPTPSQGRAAGRGDKYAMCAKCHSVCENGRIHVGREPGPGKPRQALPLDADGRTACTTCHDSIRHDVKETAGGHLRVSNQRRELCLSCHDKEIESEPRIEVVSPPEGAVVLDRRLAFIGRAFELDGAELAMRLNGAEFHLHVKGGEFSTWLTLQGGVNRIEIAQGRRLLWQGEVYRGEGAPAAYARTSSGHRTGNRDQCQECHQKRDEALAGGGAEMTPLCFGCHDRLGGKRYVHGPLAVGDCLACHDPHGGFGNAHLRHETASLCVGCHAARGAVAAVACNSAGKRCVDCHDPHESDKRYLLKGAQYTMREVSPAQQ